MRWGENLWVAPGLVCEAVLGLLAGWMMVAGFVWFRVRWGRVRYWVGSDPGPGRSRVAVCPTCLPTHPLASLLSLLYMFTRLPIVRDHLEPRIAPLSSLLSD